MSETKYTIEVNEEQARTINKALDLYSRILMFQIEEIVNVLLFSKPDKLQTWNGEEIDFQDVHAIRDKIGEIKEQLLQTPSNASHGIHSPYIANSARVAYDIQQVLRHELYLQRDREGKVVNTCTVDAYSATNTSGLELPKVEAICE